MNNNTNNYKRQTREMPQYVKDKIAAKMKGRVHSQETKNKISQGQKNAWAKIPHIKPTQQPFGTIENNNDENEDIWQ